MTVRIDFTTRALRDLGGLPRPVQERFRDAIQRLESTWPLVQRVDVKRLEGFTKAWRLRVGDYRAVFAETEDSLVFTRFGTRSTIYR